MKPSNRSKKLLGVTRSKAKMFEYDVPEEDHIKIHENPNKLFDLTIGLLGEFSARKSLDDISETRLDELMRDLVFSAHFFDAYLNSRLDDELDQYLLLLGASSYRLCDLIGSSQVLVNEINQDSLNLDSSGLEHLLYWLLKGDFSLSIEFPPSNYKEHIDTIVIGIVTFFDTGEDKEILLKNCSKLQNVAYNCGTSRELLIADIINALICKLIESSTWTSLPLYTGINQSVWKEIFQSKRFIKELWPAQHLLGKQGVFRGSSAVVQMPTSAGKTKSCEIIIRSAFLSDKANLAVIVAPFRALCQEIKSSLSESFRDEPVGVNEVSDVQQVDFNLEELLDGNQILIVTPEKLTYMFRHSPELAENIGLLIYDEGHQFDNGTRGIVYELLLASVKDRLSEKAQVILISAVISNAESVGEWLLNKDSFEVVSGSNLSPTYRTYAFASWETSFGQLNFINHDKPDSLDFFVPRVLDQMELRLFDRERKKRFFPQKKDGQSIALFLGLKLVSKGSVAIFCGRKDTASKLCEIVIDAYNRSLNLKKPVEFSNPQEVERLLYLYTENLGEYCSATQAAKIGIYTHHGNTPYGLRLSVEHAMKEGLVRFVICTSTLAQGVNLPIRYLIVTSIYQGEDRIKARDFHNLIGRAGRAGMHTEGSIIFADSVVYDEKNWRWEQVKGLLNPDSSEPCSSTLLSLFNKFHGMDEDTTLEVDILDFVLKYLEDKSIAYDLPDEVTNRHPDLFSKDSLVRQVAWKINIISAIESYLMFFLQDVEQKDLLSQTINLAKKTFAYFLATDDDKNRITELFKLVLENIEKKIPEPSKRKVFGKTLYGVWDSLKIENWLKDNFDILNSCTSPNEILKVMWPILTENISNKVFTKCTSQEILFDIASQWIRGDSFGEIYKKARDIGMKIAWGERERNLKLEHIIDICENALSYEATLVVSAILELIEHLDPENKLEIISRLECFQKILKYGLSTITAILFYELGFSDRVVAEDLSSLADIDVENKRELVALIKQKSISFHESLSKYPSYFTERLQGVL